MSPIVVSVPKAIRCLSLSETIVATFLVGELATSAALVINALTFECRGFQENILPFLFVAISCSPKLSNDHDAGSRTTVDVADALPQLTKFDASVTTAELECVVAVVPDAPLADMTKSLLDIEL